MNEKPPLRTLTIGDFDYQTQLTRKFENRRRYVAVDPRKVVCVIPGIILEINVQEGDKVGPGDRLLVLEAMKMQNDILCPLEGKIKTIHVQEKQMVSKGALLLELE